MTRVEPSNTQLIDAVTLLDAGDGLSAEVIARRLAETADVCAEVRAKALTLLRQGQAGWTFERLEDTDRVAAWRLALLRRVRPGQRVLDIGGTGGVLAMLAASAGAAVTVWEGHPMAAALVQRVVAENGFADRITVISGDVLAHPHSALAELVLADPDTDAGLSAERDEVLLHLCATRPSVRVLPEALTLRAAPVDVPPTDGEPYLESVAEFDLTALGVLTPASVAVPRNSPLLTLVGPVANLLTRALGRPPAEEAVAASVPVSARLVSGVAHWLTLEFGDGLTHDNAPHPHLVGGMPITVHRPPRALHVRIGQPVRISGVWRGTQCVLTAVSTIEDRPAA
ncbi:MAG: methyltransferase [Alphaproteobacteria bacterium]|nr:methyltransferase [Alphaproteobacteria bacterium]